MRKEDLQAIFGLSAGQEVLLFHCLRESADDLGFVHAEFEVSGRLDRARFEQAWNAAVLRHASMRTSFHWKDISRPVQVVHRTAPLTLGFVDLTLQNKSFGTELKKIRAEDKRRGFDLSTAPLLRVTVAKTGENEHLVLWAMHHLVADGWSSALVLDDVLSLYHELPRSTTSSNEQVNYQQFVEWLEARDQTADTAFWRKELAGFAPPGRVLFGGVPVDDSGHRHASVELKLTRRESDSILRAAGELRVSLATLLQGSWALALSSVLDTKDVVFGLTLAGRPHQLPGIESTVGLFATTIPLRIGVEGNVIAGEWLRGLGRKHAQILTHQHITPVQLQSVCEIPLAELFETVLVVQNYPARFIDSVAVDEGLRVGGIRGGIVSAYPLTVVVRPQDDLTLLLYGRLEYSGAIQALAETLRDTMLSLASNSNQTLEKIATALPSAAQRGITTSANGRDRLRVADRPAVTNEGDVQLTDLQQTLTTIWRDVLGHEEVGLDDNLVDLGVDSIRSIQITARIRDAGYSISPVAPLTHPTIRALAFHLDPTALECDSLADASNEDHDFQPLVPLKPDGELSPLFCLHTPGGDPIHFADLARTLEADRPVYGVKSRAADGREPFESIGEMASEYVAEMLRLLPDGRFHLFSSCGGGNVTLETARQLHDAGANVGAVIILDPGWIHPERSDWYVPEERPPLWRRLVTHALTGRLFTKIVNFVRTRYRQASRRRRAGRFRNDLDEVHRLAFDSYSAACGRHKPPQYPRRLTMILTQEWTKHRLDWPARMARWSRIAVGGIDVRSLPGWHEEALRRPRVSETCSVLESVMSETESSARLDESPRPQNPESLFRS